MLNLGQLDASGISKAIAAGQITANQVVSHFLECIAAAEPTIQVFAAFDAAIVADQLQQLTSSDARGPLAGIPLGVKDMFDTADYLTEFFSPIYKSNRPSRDAHVVALLRQAGAIIIGKTHTTEFAYMHTGPTRNPHDLARTPGSSSAGSAAGLAAGFFPIALGTQTAGSLIKPAAYCGVYAFKPSFGLVSLEGVKPLAPSFDTVGWYGRSVADLELIAQVLIPDLLSMNRKETALKLAFWQPLNKNDLELSVAWALDTAIQKIRTAGHQVHDLLLPTEFNTVFNDHQIVNDCEGARSLQFEKRQYANLLSLETHAMFKRAAATSWEQESMARQRLKDLAPQLAKITKAYDAILAPSCGIVAPIGLASTGPSDLIKFWTAFGLPQLNIPLKGHIGSLPAGLQVIGLFRKDCELFTVAAQLAEIIDLGECDKVVSSTC